MRIEAQHRTGQQVIEQWGSEPNLRAEIKRKLADQIAVKMRLEDVIDYVVTRDPNNGDTIITASVNAERTGDER